MKHQRNRFPILLIGLMVLKAVTAGSVAAQSFVSNDVTLLPSSTSVVDGETVAFRVNLTGPYAGPEIEVKIDFGDGPPVAWDRKSRIFHPYHYRDAKPFQARAIVGVNSNGGFLPRAQSAFVPITVRQKPAESPQPPTPTIGLRPDPNPAWVGENIFFWIEVRANPPPANGASLGYDLDPGDGAVPIHSASPEISYRYPRDGNFTAVARLTGTEATDKAQVIVNPKPRVSLSVPSGPLKIDESFRFKAAVDPPSEGLGYRFYLDGASSGTFSRNASIKQSYSSPGQRTVYVDVGRILKTKAGERLGDVLATSERKEIQIGEPPRLELMPAKFNGNAGDTVQFAVRLSDKSKVEGFKFDPDDHTNPSNPGKQKFSHQYKVKGIYHPTVTLNGVVAEAVVIISAPPSPPWWLVILATVAVISGAMGLARACHVFPFRPSVSFTAKPVKEVNLRPGNRTPEIGFSICLKSNLAACRCTIRTGQSRLIKTTEEAP